MVAAVEREFGRLDVLVAVAGVGGLSPFLAMPSDQFRKVHNVNVFGTFLCMREAGRAMKRCGGGGRIITISSVHGLGGTHYSRMGMTGPWRF